MAVAAAAAIGVLIAGCAAPGATAESTTDTETSSDAGMSPDEIREFYADYIAALNEHDYSNMDEFISDEIAFGEQTLTRDGIEDILAGIVDAVPDFHWEVDEIVVDGDRLAVKLTNSGTPTKEWIGIDPTGKSFSAPELAIYRVEDGRFVEMFNIFDLAAVESQLQGD